VSKVWPADTVWGRLQCLSCLGSTGLITGSGIGMAGMISWVGCEDCSVLSSCVARTFQSKAAAWDPATSVVARGVPWSLKVGVASPMKRDRPPPRLRPAAAPGRISGITLRRRGAPGASLEPGGPGNRAGTTAGRASGISCPDSRVGEPESRD
jgi:hypothetical protein